MIIQKNLLQLNNVDVTLGGKKVLSEISLQINSGENWAIIGGNGAGKSTLLKLIRADLWPDAESKGKRIYHFDDEEQSSSVGVKEKIAIISAEKQDAYVKYKCTLDGENIVFTGFFDSFWLQQEPDKSQIKTAGRIIKQLDVEHLRKIKFEEMSRGDARKILIARALVNNPAILILDEFCTGLDKESSASLLKFIDKIASSNVQILFTTHRMKEIIPSISHVLLLKDGKILDKGKREKVLTEMNLSIIFPKRTKSIEIQTLNKANHEVSSTRSAKKVKYLAKIEDVDVYIKSKKVLSSINWEMRNDENWVILGSNGAGKSTFINLICGNVVAALGGEVHRFGKEVLENMWDIRKKIGHVSANLQTNYSQNISGREVVLSGFFSSIGLWEDVTAGQEKVAAKWIKFFDIEDLAEKEIHSMSYGQFRKILIARAMVNDPDILALDEPCDGLDIQSRHDFLDAITKLCEGKTKIIYTTHHTEELIPQINKALILDKGEIIAQGDTADILKLFHDEDVF